MTNPREGSHFDGQTVLTNTPKVVELSIGRLITYSSVGYVTVDGWGLQVTYTMRSGWRIGGLDHLNRMTDGGFRSPVSSCPHSETSWTREGDCNRRVHNRKNLSVFYFPLATLKLPGICMYTMVYRESSERAGGVNSSLQVSHVDSIMKLCHTDSSIIGLYLIKTGAVSVAVRNEHHHQQSWCKHDNISHGFNYETISTYLTLGIKSPQPLSQYINL